VGEFAVLVHCLALEPAISLGLRHVAVPHQDRLGTLQQPPLFELRLAAASSVSTWR
jgi:hypothetical protein